MSLIWTIPRLTGMPYDNVTREIFQMHVTKISSLGFQVSSFFQFQVYFKFQVHPFEIGHVSLNTLYFNERSQLLFFFIGDIPNF